jgi:hypothetical protein
VRLARVVVYASVRGWEEEALVTVLPAHKVRRSAALPVDLDDRSTPVFVSHVAPADDNVIAWFCAHRLPPFPPFLGSMIIMAVSRC